MKWLKPEYFTDKTGLKAAFSGGLVSTDFLVSFCLNYGGCSVIAWVPNLVLILLAMMMLDMLTGLLKASAKKTLESRTMGEGMRRKIAVFAVIGGTILLEGVFSTNGVPLNGFLYKWATSWFIAVEALSLYENAQELGVRIPDFLKEMTQRLLRRAEHGGYGYEKKADS